MRDQNAPNSNTTTNSAPALIALGSNLGDRTAHLHSAFHAIAALPTTTLLACAIPIETEPLGPPGQGPYLNAAALIYTALEPRALLEALLNIEHAHARIRAHDHPRWGPRTLDLDLILYNNHTINEPGLTIPHPRLHERDFVLRPAVALAPHWPHPTLHRTLAQLLA
ncbi:MAG: 2-amino-4-hydroxy-6-hydroxymethyldihydropteridine diphosphokinase, partial [Phycisphaerales bacterium]